MLGGWEIVLILAVVLILFGARQLPDITRWLGTTGLDNEAERAGKNVGSIFGKPAAQALTHDNHAAEFLERDVLRRQASSNGLGSFWTRWLRRLWKWAWSVLLKGFGK